jgi:hypothetical protein
MAVKHAKTSAINDTADASLVQPSDWNADHTVVGGVDLPLETVTAPAANNVRLFGRKVGGRMMPAFVEPSGLDTALQPSLARNKVAWWTAVGNGTGVSQLGMAANTVGTATTASVATTNLHTAMRRLDYLVTTASTTAIALLQTGTGSANQFFRGTGGLGGFHAVFRFGGATGMATSTHRFYAGFTSISTITDIEPSARDNIIGAGYDSTDANWQIMHKTGTGAVTKINLGASFPRQSADRSKMYDLALFCAPGGSSVFYEFTDLDTGAVATGEISTNLPGATTLIRGVIAASVGGTSSVIGISLVSLYIETDY